MPNVVRSDQLSPWAIADAASREASGFGTAGDAPDSSAGARCGCSDRVEMAATSLMCRSCCGYGIETPAASNACLTWRVRSQ